MLANSNLIKLISSKLTIYKNIFICNNLNKTTNRLKKILIFDSNKFFGSGIYAVLSKINMYGGEISNNIHEIFIDENYKETNLPAKIDKDLYYSIRGVGLYMNNRCSEYV